MPRTAPVDMHARLLALHEAEDPLLIANVWDAASAALWQHAGATAIATGSAALAWACGYADGGALPRATLLDRTHDIARVASVPVSIDVEDGYSDDPRTVAALVRELVDAGVVGINLEDGSGDPELLVAKIEAIRATPGGASLFINARTDVYFRGMARGNAAVEMVAERVARYADAGADGAFVPGVAAIDEIAAIASRTPLPLNVMTVPGLPSVANLRAAGVRRISVGPALFQHAFAAGLRATRQFLGGEMPHDLDTAMPYGELNALLSAD